MTLIEEMGQKINDLCIDNDVSHKELSEYCKNNGCKCSEATISDIIKGKDKGYDYRTIMHIARRLNTTVDYLLGDAPCSTQDKDVRFICEYTGLTERAVEALRALSQMGNYDYNCAISEIIETVQDELDNILMGYGETEVSLFRSLVRYLETDFLNNGKILDIALSGNLVDTMNTDRQVGNEIRTDFRNLIKIGQLKTREVIEQVLLNDIIEKLKELKRNSKLSKEFSFDAFNKEQDNDNNTDIEDLPF